MIDLAEPLFQAIEIQLPLAPCVQGSPKLLHSSVLASLVLAVHDGSKSLTYSRSIVIAITQIVFLPGLPLSPHLLSGLMMRQET